MAWGLNFCLVLLWMSGASQSSDISEELTPRLKLLVSSLQEQIVDLQREQLQNRMVIRSLQQKLEQEITRRSLHGKRTEDSNKRRHTTLSRIVRSQLADYFPRQPNDMAGDDSKTSSIDDDLRTILEGLCESLEFLDDRKKNLTESGKTIRLSSEMEKEWESLRTELDRLRQDIEMQKDASDKLDDFKSDHITVKWLQKTVTDMRSEISELAAALNMSVALRENQGFENVLEEVRTDLASLRREMDRDDAGLMRQSTALEELRQELEEVRTMAISLSASHQRLLDEVSTLKDELSESREFKISAFQQEDLLELGSGSGENIETVSLTTREDGRKPKVKHHQGISSDILDVRNSLVHLKETQFSLQRLIYALRDDQRWSQAKITNLQKTLSKLDNRTSSLSEELWSQSKNLDESRAALTIIQERSLQNRMNIVNFTEAMTGMDKVHSSTVQLFEALESLEEEYSQSFGDLQKELTKFEFNVAQVQGSFDILRHDQSSHFDQMKSLKADMATLRQDFRNDHYRLVSMQNDVLNRSLHQCGKENEETLRDLKIANLELQLSKLSKKTDDSQQQFNAFYGRLGQKVDKSAIENIAVSQRGIVEEMKHISSQLPNISSANVMLKTEYTKLVEHILPQDCSMDNVPFEFSKYKSGLYLIKVPGLEHAKEVFCEFPISGERWTMVQRRQDGSENFFRNWEEYREGFGSASAEFWIGNEVLHRLTSERNYTLRIEMWDIFDNFRYAEYSNFRVGTEEAQYTLEVGEYSGNASDSLRHHHKMGFSTHDRDNDASSTHCAMYYSAGWWYQHCQYANVNGRYAIGMTWYDADNRDWVQLAKVEMKIKPIFST